jgi:hypothetical protein
MNDHDEPAVQARLRGRLEERLDRDGLFGHPPDGAGAPIEDPLAGTGTNWLGLVARTS